MTARIYYAVYCKKDKNRKIPGNFDVNSRVATADEILDLAEEYALEICQKEKAKFLGVKITGIKRKREKAC